MSVDGQTENIFKGTIATSLVKKRFNQIKLQLQNAGKSKSAHRSLEPPFL